MRSDDTLIILVHDAWHGAWEWEAVQQRLDERDWQSVAIDLPGHGAFYRPQNTPVQLTLEDYSREVAAFVRLQEVPNVVLVGQGTAGPLCQRAAEMLGQHGSRSKLAGLVLAGAFILRDGETLAQTFPPTMVAVFQELAARRPDYCLSMADLDTFWRFSVMSDDVRQADAVLARLTPEPFAPLLEKISLKTFFEEPPPCAYLSYNEDNLLPPGDFYPRMANKLGQYKHFSVNAGHEGPLTKPREVAEALIYLVASAFYTPLH